MKNLLLDVWHDLLAKRLWPVAAVLLAGIVAVPLVLAKQAEQPAVPPPPAAQSKAPEAEAPAELAEVKLEDLGQGSGSSLSSFDDPSNPFAPPPKVLDRIRAVAGGDASASSGASGASGGGSPAPSIDGDVNLNIGSPSGGAGSGSGDTGGGSTGDTGAGTGDTGGGTGDTPAPPVDGGEKTTTVSYTYVADVTFRANDRRRKIKGLEKLDILPDRANPLLIFLGVTADAGNTVFLVDSTLKTAGEGSCRPSKSECAFLYLGPGSEHEFTNEAGDSYTLRVDEIRRVKLGDGKKKAGASKKEKKKVAGAAVEQPSPARRFSPPLLADVVSVSSGEAINSNSGSDRR
jgi:hypothetical protein